MFLPWNRVPLKKSLAKTEPQARGLSIGPEILSNIRADIKFSKLWRTLTADAAAGRSYRARGSNPHAKKLGFVYRQTTGSPHVE
ncbi:hypothetical protein TNCV_3071171 [Trichonephila clavipes]|nr:hypothetical protein TNCV_3071171 [Trichonephila clavipes]